MRPQLLNPLFSPLHSLKGIGSALEKPLTALLRPNAVVSGETARLIDGLFHMPTGLVDRRAQPNIINLPERGIVTIKVQIRRHIPRPKRQERLPYRVEVADETGVMMVIFFHLKADNIVRLLPLGETRIISGSIDWYNGIAQMSHPDYIIRIEDREQLPMLEPVYPLREGIYAKVLSRTVKGALEALPALPEWLDPVWKEQQKWASFAESLQAIHQPKTIDHIELTSQFRQRLGYDELLANQLALILVRARMKRSNGFKLSVSSHIREKLRTLLPFQLTQGQEKAIADILGDMASPQRMLRLLQGDVGSGKTIVALFALAAIVEAKGQGALMVPTEILARQHYAKLLPLCAACNMRLALLTGRDKATTRQQILTQLAQGEIDILIGTHAIFQADVIFQALGLVIIDEQHRFGVNQRLSLQAKAISSSHLLLMSATPIPRSLALTIYGDMDVSKLMEKPDGRLKIDTRTLPITRLEEVIARLKQHLVQGNRAYWVCPLVEENELLDLAAAQARFENLKSHFPGKAGMVHGKQKTAEREAVMADFKAGTLDILISTTVIEVGVDVPEATIIIIENAERFGLAQLHQLRGRVGRGHKKSVCLLLYQTPLSHAARARLGILRETEDGFLIAEEDLRLRGAGEVLGTRQTGLPLFHFADISVHGDLLAAARDDAQLFLNRDPMLQTARGQALQILLYLFEREEAVRLLAAG